MLTCCHASIPTRVAPVQGRRSSKTGALRADREDQLHTPSLGCGDFLGGKPEIPTLSSSVRQQMANFESLQELTTADGTGSCSRRADCPPGQTPSEPRPEWRCELRSAPPAGTARRNPSSWAEGQTPSCTRCTGPGRAKPRSRTNLRSSFPR